MEKRTYPSVPEAKTRAMIRWLARRCPKGSSAQLPTPPGIALSEPSQEWPLVDTHHFSPVREALFNTLRKDVHRGQKDSVIGTSDHLRAGENHLDRIRVNNNVESGRPVALKEFTRGHQLCQNKERSAAYCSRKHSTYTYSQVVRVSF
ncbi:hypothetical protein D5086_032152 [Populus alba]|uniref:Uncharacterized protein n=1 Tax=Populus alba TaxID=43335 RepID=A0ACC4ALH2_POPAL